jgi:hypothetical protein
MRPRKAGDDDDDDDDDGCRGIKDATRAKKKGKVWWSRRNPTSTTFREA